MTIWEIAAVLTPALGVLMIIYALRFFPIVKDHDDQLEFDLNGTTRFVRRARSVANDVHRAADMINEEVDRIKAKPKIKR